MSADYRDFSSTRIDELDDISVRSHVQILKYFVAPELLRKKFEFVTPLISHATFGFEVSL